jgi:hypothetical protein
MSGGDYEVGYGKPPKASQFKPGRSGNPKGRARGARSLRTILRREMAQTLTVTEDGKTRRLSKLEALVKRLFAKGLNGDLRALSELIKLLSLHFPEHPDADAEDGVRHPLPDEDLALLRAFVERQLGDRNK